MLYILLKYKEIDREIIALINENLITIWHIKNKRKWKNLISREYKWKNVLKNFKEN